MSTLFQPFPMPAGHRAQAWRHQPAYRRPRHFHDEPEINLVLRGSCVLGIGERNVEVSRGQMLLFEPGQDHELLDASDDLDLFVIALRPELAERALGARTLRSIRCSELAPAELAALGSELATISDVSDAACIEARLAGVFSLALERAPKAHVQSSRALECLRAEPELSEAVIARRLGTAPSGISRHFRADVGMTLVEYRSRLRLMRFIELVDRGESFSRAALEADFGSYAQCHRVFRRALGCAPRDYFAGMRNELDRVTIEGARSRREDADQR